MFVIITYDIAEAKILNKVRKTLKKYLIWTQNSVFEGEILPGKLHKCVSELENIIGSYQNLWYARYILIPVGERHLEQTRWHEFDRDVRG